jgi:probable biosynthetic protein (TIGR04099 family)
MTPLTTETRVPAFGQAADVPKASNEQASTRVGRVQLGMPQLSGVGLSETWLLEKCGDLHWAMICDRLGRPSHEMRDASGHRVYSSFVALRVTSQGLDGFGEGETLHHSSALVQRSRTRFESLQRWRSGSKTVDVEMLSVFLRRRGDASNSMEEADIPSAPGFSRDTISDLEGRFRGQNKNCGGEPAILHVCTWQPTLALDYNGARLLYFARYHHIVERAEASVFSESFEACYAVECREIYYFANLDPGEEVTVGFTEICSTDWLRRHRAEIRRARDGRLMARVITAKKRCATASRT